MTDLSWSEPVDLPTGGQTRSNGAADAETVVLLAPGGTGTSRAGRWSSNWRFLAPLLRAELDPAGVRIVEVRYTDSSWRDPTPAIADLGAALAHERARVSRPRRIVLVGFSMGGYNCIRNAGGDDIVGMVGIAPWLASDLSMRAMAGKRLYVVHGSLDGRVPFIPGVAPRYSRTGVRRAQALGADAVWTDVPGAIHGFAVRGVGSGLLKLPRAARMARLVVDEVVRQVATPV